MPRRGVQDFDLGLSDDDDSPPPPRGGRGGFQGRKKEESIEDLLGGKDTTKMFGGSAGKKQSVLSGLGSGGDPLDMLKQADLGAVGRGGQAFHQEPEMTDEELEFQRQLERELGMVGLGAGEESPFPAMSSGAGRRKTPTPPAATPGSHGGSESLDDIMGDILNENRPARRQQPARSASPAPAAPEPQRTGQTFGDEYGGDSLGFEYGGARGGRRQMAGSQRAPSEEPYDDFEDNPYPSQARGGRRSRGPPSAAGASEREGSYAPSDRSAGGSAAGFGGGFGAAEGGRFGDFANYGADDSFQAGGLSSFGATSSGPTLEGRAGRRKLAQRPPPAPADDDPFGLDSSGPKLGGGRSVSPSPGPGGRFGGSGVPSRTSTPPPATFGVGDEDTGTPNRGFGDPGIPPSGRHLRRASTAPVPDQEALGGLGGFGQDDAALGRAGAPAGAPFEADLELAPRPKRRTFGQAKAKASPKASPSPQTLAADKPPTPEKEEPPPLPHSQRGSPMGAPAPEEPRRQPSPMQAGFAVPPDEDSPRDGADFNDSDGDGGLDDLLVDNTQAKSPIKPPSPAQAPSPAAASAAPRKGDSDEELPSFLRQREGRQKRGERSVTPASGSSVSPTPAASRSPGLSKAAAVAADLGLDPADVDVPEEADNSGSGSHVMEVKLEPRAKKRLQRPAVDGSSAGQPSLAGSAAVQPPPDVATPAGAPQALGAASPGHSVTPQGVPSPHSVTPQAVPSPQNVTPQGVPSPHSVTPQRVPSPHSVTPQGVPSPHSFTPQGVMQQNMTPQGVPSPMQSATPGAAKSAATPSPAHSLPQSGVPPGSEHGGSPGLYGTIPGSAQGHNAAAPSSTLSQHGRPQTPGVPPASVSPGAQSAGAFAAAVPPAGGAACYMRQVAQASACPVAMGSAVPSVTPSGATGAVFLGVPPVGIPGLGMPGVPPGTPGHFAAGVVGVPSAAPTGLAMGVPGLPPGTPSAAPGVPAATLGAPSEHGGVPLGCAGIGYEPQTGLPPGSPLTATPLPSDGASLYAQVKHADPPAGFGQVREPIVAIPQQTGLAGGLGVGFTSPKPSDRRTGAEHGGECTPTSEPVLSLFGGADAGFGGDLGGRTVGNFSAFPPLTAAPQADLLSKLAYSEAKVRQLELQLEDCELRWQQRLTDQKQSSDAEHERMEMQCRRLEAEMDRQKDIHSGDIRHLNETKQMLLQNFEMEKESARRDERRKMQLEVDKLRGDHALEIEELRRKHERALSIAQQQAEIEAESLRRAHSDEQQLSRLVEQVQSSVTQVEKMSKRVEGEKGLEWSVRERQLEAREKSARDMESRLSAQSKEVEDQRKRVSELVRHMENSQKDDRDALAVERERLESEHRRLLELQQSVRDADRNNKEALKHSWAQLEDERRKLQQDALKTQGDVGARQEEVELQERRVRQEVDRLKDVHAQVETARQNAARRIRETEATIANERRCLMNDLEAFEEKRRIFAAEVQKLDAERKVFQDERSTFEQEVTSVRSMAAAVQCRSEELKTLKDQTDEAREEIQRLRGQLEDERKAQGTELERLKTMQTLVEQQRLQLLQTENHLREQRIEDVDVLVTSKAIMPADNLSDMNLKMDMNLDGGYPMPTWDADVIQPPAATAIPQADGMMDVGCFGTGPGLGAGAFGQQVPAEAIKQPAMQPRPTVIASRPGATPISRIAAGHGASGEALVNRMRLQTVLRRSREESSNMHVFIKEQYQFLQQEMRPSISADGAVQWGAGPAPAAPRPSPSALREFGAAFMPHSSTPVVMGGPDRGGVPGVAGRPPTNSGDSSEESPPLDLFDPLGVEYRSSTSGESSRLR